MVFSDTYISEYDAESLIARSAASSVKSPSSKDVEYQNGRNPLASDHPRPGNGNEIYETLWLHDQEYLCTIPIVETPPRNETSEAQARAKEQQELVRATNRGWELLQGLDGQCLYFISGWWSYAFCYNKEITQFHQLPMPPGRSQFPPTRDPNTAEYILGKTKVEGKDKEDEYGNEVQLRKAQHSMTPPTTEIQIKGDSRYLIQRLDGGTICDLTGKPRKVEVQYHCSPQASDRIGWIREVTTCSYVMVVYTPRLCGDIAFQPPKEVRANAIACRMVVPEDEVSFWSSQKTIEAEGLMQGVVDETPVVNVGGVILGANKYVGADGNRLPLPPNWTGNQASGPAVDIIARSKGKSDGGQIEVLSSEDLEKLDLDPKIVEQLKQELEKLAGDKGWKLEVVEIPGDVREIRGVVDGDGEEEDAEYVVKKDDSGNEGSEETYKEEL